MAEYHDTLETRPRADREAALFAALPQQILNARSNTGWYRELLADVEPGDVDHRAALAALPVTRKSDLIERQRAHPPFGGLAATPISSLARVFASPGPIYEPEAGRDDYWRMARALYAAGIRRGDLVHNCFAYHFTPAGFMLESGARALGCPVFPAGTGQSELQVQAIAQYRPAAYVGTPSFLRIILEKAEALGSDVSSLSKGLVSGEALPPSLRERLQAAGVSVLQCYATADLGLIAYESRARDGLIVDEGVILEIVRPGTGEVVAPGEVGEVLVTTLNADYPLIRFATGDLSALMAGESPCGRTNMRIRGWLGRADQTTKVRGMFVHPAQVAEVARRHRAVGRARLVVDSEDGHDRMTLHCEVAGEPAPELAEALAETLREICKLRGEVAIRAPGALPNDGKVIDDQRRYE